MARTRPSDAAILATQTKTLAAFKKKKRNAPDPTSSTVYLYPLPSEFSDREIGILISDPGTTNVYPGVDHFWFVQNNTNEAIKVKFREFVKKGTTVPYRPFSDSKSTKLSVNVPKGETRTVQITMDQDAVPGTPIKYCIHVNRVRAIDPELDIIPIFLSSIVKRPQKKP